MIINYYPCIFCRECQTFLECFVQAVTNETEAAKTYVEQFGDASLTDYYEYYGCVSGKHKRIAT